MMRSRFDQQLDQLNEKLLEMGAMVEDAIGKAARALTEQDGALANEVMAGDEAVDRMEKEIESLCLSLLLKQQPVARDLRLISSALKFITDMERIGDQAADISEITLYLLSQPYAKRLIDIPKMAEETMRMLTLGIDAFVQKDIAMAERVIDSDDVVDALFVSVKRDLIAMIQQNEAHSEQAMDLLMVAKYLERIGDHAVNIARWVYFSITGTHINK